MLRRKLEFINHSSCFLENNINRYFGHYLDSILGQRSDRDLKETYVENPVIDEKLKSLITSNVTSRQYFIGHKGIGKSTSIKYSLNEENIKKLIPCRKFELLKKSFDSSFEGENPDEFLMSKVESLTRSKLEEKYENEIDRNKAMFNFVSTNKDIVHLLDEIKYFKLYEDTSFDEQKFIDFRENFKENHTQRYIAFLLKFCTYEFGIERVFIILDDMESLGFDVSRLIVKNVCKIVDCLHHISGENVFISLLISCRPYTHSIIKDELSLDGWHSPDPINYEDPVSLSEVFRKKFLCIVKTDGEGQLSQSRSGDLEKWRLALNSLLDAVNNLCNRRGGPICTLNNNDIRAALCSLVRVLKSPFWHNRNVEGAFSPEISGRVQETQAMFIRALSIKSNSSFYSDNAIFNIFQNTNNSSTDLLYSFIYSYLINTNEQAISRKEMERSLCILFPSELVINSINFEINRSRIMYSELVKGDEYIVKLPSVRGLKDLISQSSVYTELMMADVYIDGSVYEKIHNLLPDRGFSTNHRYGEMMLKIVLEYSSYMFQKESCLLLSGYQKNKVFTMYDYSNHFGDTLVSESVVESIRNSINRYYVKNCSTEVIQNASSYIRSISEKIKTFKMLYQKNFVINEKDVYFNDDIFEYLILQCGNVVYIGDLIEELGVEYFDLFRTILTINNDIYSKIAITFMNSSKIVISDTFGVDVTLPISPKKLEEIQENFDMIRDILKRASNGELGIDTDISTAIEILKTGGKSKKESNETLKGILHKLNQQAKNLSSEGAKAAVQSLIKTGVSLLT